MAKAKPRPVASVSVAIIARNAEKTIAACLDSIVPYVAEVVVCVDKTTTDLTARVARKHGAHVFTGLAVSEEHECPRHGKVLAQHFARAREASFAKTRPDTEWLMWIDADDVVRAGDKLPALVAGLAPEVGVVWLPYHYSKALETGPTTTLFDRERLVRRAVGWQWLYRVHEVLAPVSLPMEQVPMLRNEEIAIIHQNQGHDTAGSAQRNILLLEIDLEENPLDDRALFYMGNQWYALGEYAQAAEWYERALGSENVYQQWQTALYLSMSCEKMGDLRGATQAAHIALESAPYHSEPYFRLAAIAMLVGDTQRCEFWDRLARQMPDPPPFAFKNPLDRTFNSYLTLAQAYATAGEASKARRALEQAAKVIPTPDLLTGIAEQKALEAGARQANAFVETVGPALREDRLPAAFARQLAEPVWRYGRARDVVAPALLRARPNTQPRLLVLCGRSAEPWAPPSLNGSGIGGSETAVIQIARRFARDGWRVDVYNDPDRYEGEYDDVGYWENTRFSESERAEVLVSWRQPGFHVVPVERRLSLLWCHDLHSGPGAGPDMGRWDRVLGVSAWHADYLRAVYQLENVSFAPNGIDLSRFAPGVRKVPFRCVYASSPDRGLERLLQLWPHLLAVEPTAELHVAYGWETFDRYIQMGNPNLAQIKATIEDLLKRTPRVVWRGRLPQDELAKLYQESYCWLYPTSFTEVSCISAMEAMAGGAVPVVSAVGALPQTVGDGGIVVNGNTYTQAWKEFWIACAKATLLSPPTRLPLMQAGRERAKEFTWDNAYAKWKEIVMPALENRRPVLEVVG